MGKCLLLTHPLPCIKYGPSVSGKSVFLTILILNNINEYDKINIYSPILHQDLYQKLIKYFTNCKPIHKIPNILKEKDIDVVIDEIIISKTLKNLT